MTVADLVRRGVVLEWYESVALVRAILQYLLLAPQSSVFPDLREIELSDQGEVTILAAGRIDDPVGRANQLLRVLLADAEPPIQLRLLLSRATFGSMAEYDESLAYFERPGRPNVISALHARAAAKMEDPEPPAPAEGPTLDTMTATAEPPKEPAVPIGTAARSRALAAAAMLLFAVSTAAAVALYTARSAPASPSGASALAQRASETLSDVVKTGLSTVSESAGFGRLIFDDPADAAAPSAAAPAAGEREFSPARHVMKPQVAAVESRRAGATVTAREETSPRDAPVEPRPVSGAAAAAPVAATPDAGEAALHGSSSLIVEAFANNDPPIYTIQSPGIVPAVSINPPSLPELPSHVDSSQFGKIELIIAPDGSVESVRLLRILGNVQHSILLSAVKAWRFEPATKDGAPVRYREVVWLAPGLSKDSLAWRAGR